MNNLIKTLFDSIDSSSEMVSNNAITDLSFVLEIKLFQFSLAERKSKYDGLTDSAIFNVIITDSEQIEIIDHIKARILTGHQLTTNLLYILRLAVIFKTIEVLNDVICDDIWLKFSEMEVYQLIDSIHEILFCMKNNDMHIYVDSIKADFRQRDIKNKICYKILSLDLINYKKLESTALYFLCQLTLWLENEDWIEFRYDRSVET